MELNEIVANIDPSSFTYHGEKKFKRKNLTQYDRALVETFDIQIKIRDKVAFLKFVGITVSLAYRWELANNGRYHNISHWKGKLHHFCKWNACINPPFC